MEQTDLPLLVSVVEDYAADGDAASMVPGVPPPGVPLDPAQAAIPEHSEEDAPDYANVSVLRAGDSGQTFAGVADPGLPADRSGFYDSGSAGGDAGD